MKQHSEMGQRGCLGIYSGVARMGLVYNKDNIRGNIK